MIIRDITCVGPARGDTLFLECGDTLFEATITDTVDDGVVIQLDESVWDRLKGMIQKPPSVDELIAKKTLNSLGYLIGIANMRDANSSGMQLLQRTLDDNQLKTFSLAVNIAHRTDPIKRDNTLLDGIQRAQRDAASADEHDIARLIKIAYSHLENGMNFLQTQDTPHAPHYEPTKHTTRWGDLDEAKYQGREVPLGKPMKGDVKKSKVYVKKPNGTVVKVNFGDKKMRIKKSNPKRRKSFRARHNCANPGPRWKARYWSCRAW